MTETTPRAPLHHVLLIGIDAYDGGASLRGCVNDIDVIQRLLIDKVGVHPTRITRLVSPHSGTTHVVDEGIVERNATLENIRAELTRLGSDEVHGDDRVFIYYSGHGTQIKVVDPQTGTTYVREALVPRDHIVRVVKRQYLFDWELNGLLAAIAGKTTSVVCVLDCCCAGGATRDVPGSSSQMRYIESPQPYELPADQPPPGSQSRRGLTSGLLGTVQACQVVAACLDDERARESDGEDGMRHGELTRALQRRLDEVTKEALADLRWGRIWYDVLADVLRANPAQHPWISGGFARRVFGGPPEDGDMGYSVTREGDVYHLRVGSLFGVTRGAELLVYGSTPPRLPAVGSAQDRALRPRRIRVESATPSTAVAVAVDTPFQPEPGARARLVKAGEAARLRVGLAPESKAIRELLEPSTLVEVVGGSDPSDVALVQRSDGAWALLDDVFGAGEAPGEPWIAVVPADLLEHVREVVEHYYWYSMPLRVAKNCQDLPRSLRLGIHDARGAGALSPADAQDLGKLPELSPGKEAPYVLAVGEDEKSAASVCFGVRNHSTTDLVVTLIACNNSGRVAVLSQKVIPGGGSHVFWAGDTIRAPFPITRLQGRSLCVDRIVAIGTTNRTASLAHLRLDRSFEEILAAARGRGSSREVGDTSRSGPPPELWTADVTAMRLVVP